MDYKADIRNWLEEHKAPFHHLANDLWAHPELSMQEFRSSALHRELLEKEGFRITEKAGGLDTAFVATWGQGKPVIGFNCEYDALPGLSQTPGVAHQQPIERQDAGQGCGHNLLGTAASKAVVALKNWMSREKIRGTLKVFGCPAEELCIGKPVLGKAGLYKGVDAFLDWHPWSYNRADYDHCNAYFSVKYHFKGQTAHGNSPWKGRSALDGAQLMAHAIEMMREHYPSAPADAANTLNYTYSDTGPAFPSVVPDHAALWCIGRFQTAELSETIMERLEKAARGCALATSTEVEIEKITATHHKIPNQRLAAVVHQNMIDCGLPDYNEEELTLFKEIQKNRGLEPKGPDRKIKEFGSSGTALCDTSEFTWHAPYATFWLAMAPHDGWHNWMVTACAGSSIGLRAMDKAAEILACSAQAILKDEEILTQAREEWALAMEGKTYQALI